MLRVCLPGWVDPGNVLPRKPWNDPESHIHQYPEIQSEHRQWATKKIFKNYSG